MSNYLQPCCRPIEHLDEAHLLTLWPHAGLVTSIGYAPYAAGLYLNSRYGNQWMMLFGASLCGISAGVFWM